MTKICGDLKSQPHKKTGFIFLQRLGRAPNQPGLSATALLDRRERPLEGGLAALPPPPRLDPAVRGRGQVAQVKARGAGRRKARQEQSGANHRYVCECPGV